MKGRFGSPIPRRLHKHYMLFVAGMGGLLYGIDVGIIAGALPYLEASASHFWKPSTQQLGFVVAAAPRAPVSASRPTK